MCNSRRARGKHPSPEAMKSSPENKYSSPSDFYSGMATAAVACICKSTGFSSAKRSAIEVLAGVAAVHLHHVAGRSASYAAARRRTEVNFFDFLHAVDSPAVNLNLTFPIYTDANFTARSSPIEPSAANLGEISPPAVAPATSHIPPWLPEIPDVKLLNTEFDQMRTLIRKRDDRWIAGEDEKFFAGGEIEEMNKHDHPRCFRSSKLPRERERLCFFMKKKQYNR